MLEQLGSFYPQVNFARAEQEKIKNIYTCLPLQTDSSIAHRDDYWSQCVWAILGTSH